MAVFCVDVEQDCLFMLAIPQASEDSRLLVDHSFRGPITTTAKRYDWKLTPPEPLLSDARSCLPETRDTCLQDMHRAETLAMRNMIQRTTGHMSS